MSYYSEIKRNVEQADHVAFTEIEKNDMVEALKDIYLDRDDSLKGIMPKVLIPTLGLPLLALGGIASVLGNGIDMATALKERKHLRDTQYDLLLLEFISFGLSDFLDLHRSNAPL
jgi:hypothetical protein